jgi:hypothetical protein
VFVGIHPQGPRGVVLFDDDGKPVAEFALRTEDSPPTLWLGSRDPSLKDRPRLILYAESDGGPGLVLFDKNGHLTWRTPKERE